MLQRLRLWLFPWPSASGWWIAAVLGLVGCFLLVVGLQVSDPYVIDEAAFPYAAEGIIRHIGPFFYNGETRPNDLGMWHPPAYVYLLALDYMILGESVVSTRLFGVTTVLVTLVIGFRTIRRGFPTASGMSYTIFAALFLTSPLIIGGALVPDIDGTVGLVAAALLTYLAISITSDISSRNVLLMSSLVWSFALLTKFTISLIFLPVIVLAIALSHRRGRYRKALAVLFGLLIGVITCVLVIRAAAYAGDFPASAPLDYFRYGLGRSQTDLGYLDRVRKNVGPEGLVVYWTGGMLLVLPLLLLALRACRSFSFASGRRLLVLACVVYGAFFAYLLITSSPFGFPKYFGIVVAPAAVFGGLLGEYAYRVFKSSLWVTRIRDTKFIIFAPEKWVPFVIAASILIVDFYIGFFFVLSQQRDAGLLFRAGGMSVLVGSVVMLVLGILIKRRPWPIWQTASAFIVVIFLVTSLGFQAGQSFGNARATFSTRYYYGERGLSQVLAFMNNAVPQNGVILAAKDVGQQSGRRFYEDAAVFYGPPYELKRLLESGIIDAIVTRDLWDYSEQGFPGQFRLIRKYYCPAPQGKIGDFQVWFRCEE
jgi:4-amino-4-deoxy-L-arabinose transferase-like glycosyltransferase